tara:strand:- start:836 stop:1357 length:522 start_codon:yes stop_codon:yes gene_type:complete
MKSINLSVIFFILNTNLINSYQTSNSILTHFTSRNEIENFFCSSKFYDEYFKLVDAENIIIESPSYDISAIPKKFSYYSKPNIPYMPKFLPKIKIQHNWYKNENEYFGDIKTKYIEFELIIKPVKNYDSYNYTLQIDASILKKNKKIIPNRCLDYLLEDFCGTFIQITDKLDS